MALGDYVYRSGTAVPCGINADDADNSPERFTTPVEGPFPGDGWNQWIGHDLSDWWLSDIPIETVTIPVSDDVALEAWWIKASYPTAQETVIVTHGYGTSRRDYNALLPSSMLATEGFNVLLVDQRDTGNSTCVDGRHSAGQDESDDFARVAEWLVAEKGITPDKIGMFGVSGGAIATAILPAKTDNVSAFAMEAPIFDFAGQLVARWSSRVFRDSSGVSRTQQRCSVGWTSTRPRFRRESTPLTTGLSCFSMALTISAWPTRVRSSFVTTPRTPVSR